MTVPVLWDTHTKRIVSNSDDDIMRMFETEFDALARHDVDLYPKEHRAAIDRLNDVIYETVNDGVYRAGFAATQAAYEPPAYRLFEELDALDARLADRRYLFGAAPVETDWRLFVTLIRFDAVYHGHFKCNLRRIVDYPNLSGYLRDLYQVRGIAPTVNFDHIKRHYYMTHDDINPTRIVPIGPLQNLNAPHGRERIERLVITAFSQGTRRSRGDGPRCERRLAWTTRSRTYRRRHWRQCSPRRARSWIPRSWRAWWSTTSSSCFTSDGAALYWWDAHEEVLTALADNDPRVSVPIPVINPGQGITGGAFERDEALTRAGDGGHDEGPTWMRELHIKAGAAVPIHVEGRPRGVLVARSYTERTFTAHDLEVMRVAGEQIAPTLANMGLLARAQRERNVAHALAELMRAATAAEDVEALMHLIVRYATRLLGADFGRIETHHVEANSASDGEPSLTETADSAETLSRADRDAEAHVRPAGAASSAPT